MKGSIVELPGPCIAATADGDTVWCAAGSRLLAFEAAGDRRLETPITPGVRSLGVMGNTLAATLEPGVVAWLAAQSGKVVRRVSVGGEPVLVSGGGAVWAVDASTDRAWRLGDAGTLIGPTAVPGVDHAAADGQRLWWTSRPDATLRSFDRAVDLGVPPAERGALVVCAGSVWVSVAKGLVRVNAWNAEKGEVVPVPVSQVSLLACAAGVLIGGSGREGLFVLDPSADADARRLDADLGGDVTLLVATRTTAWVFPAQRAEARLVTVRAG